MLLHVVPLQLNGITGEDCELVEFNAVLEGIPSLLTGSLVERPVHCDPGILLMHLLDHLVPLGTSFADKVGANQLISLTISFKAFISACLWSFSVASISFWRLSFSC